MSAEGVSEDRANDAYALCASMMLVVATDEILGVD